MSASAEVALDLRLLALLHDHEPNAALLRELRQEPLQDLLALAIADKQGLALFDQALAALPEVIEGADLDELAADYADIYLTFACRAAPTESIWLDEDGLDRQQPMFAVREWYRHHGLAAADWRRRPDDHIVPQLVFIAHLLEQGEQPEAPREVARFMDRHILRWIGEFADRVATRCRTPYFAGVALVTAAYLEGLRDVLTEMTGEPRWQPETTQAPAGCPAACA